MLIGVNAPFESAFKVWEVEDCGKYAKVQLGDSSKKQDGTYDNWTWFAKVIGERKVQQIMELKGERIIVKNGELKKYKGKDGQWYMEFVVFEFDLADGSKKSSKPSGDSVGYDFSDYEISDDDDCPF